MNNTHEKCVYTDINELAIPPTQMHQVKCLYRMVSVINELTCMYRNATLLTPVLIR